MNRTFDLELQTFAKFEVLEKKFFFHIASKILLTLSRLGPEGNPGTGYTTS